LVLGRRPLGTILHSSNEPGELSQWLCHDDSTINIVVVIIIIIIIVNNNNINIIHHSSDLDFMWLNLCNLVALTFDLRNSQLHVKQSTYIPLFLQILKLLWLFIELHVTTASHHNLPDSILRLSPW